MMACPEVQRRKSGPLARMWHSGLSALCLLALTLYLVVCSPASIAAASLPNWQWPVHPVVIARSFEAPASAYGPGHRGIDLRAPAGSLIYAPVDARVSFAGQVAGRGVLTLVPDTPGSEWAASFDAIETHLRIGELVSAGAPVGVAVPSAHCSCLHLGVRWRGEYVSPLLVLGVIPRAVLLPW